MIHTMLVAAAGVAVFMAGVYAGMGVIWDAIRCRGGRWPLEGKPPRSCGANVCLAIILAVVFTVAAIATR